MEERECTVLPTLITRANTHKDFLKKVFNTTGTGGMSLKQYPSNPHIYIWMVKFFGTHENWKNRTVKIDGEDYIREKYVGTEPNPIWNGKPITLKNVMGPLRLAVSIKKAFNDVTYEILGLYILDMDLSEDLNRVYKRIDDNVAKLMIPEAYDKNY